MARPFVSARGRVRETLFSALVAIAPWVGCRPAPTPAPKANPAVAPQTPAARPPASRVAHDGPPSGPVGSPYSLPATPSVAELRDRVRALKDNYAARIEARHAMIACITRNDPGDAAFAAIMELLNDVEQHDGRAMAREVAMTQGISLRRRGAHALAARVFSEAERRCDGNEQLVERAICQQGEALLDARAYSDAESAFQRLLEGSEDAQLAPWAWRRLALAQLLQGHFDASIATLRVMAEKYVGTEHADYARMRQGYVQMAAGRIREARATYEAFLKECGQSVYCELARTELRKLASVKG